MPREIQKMAYAVLIFSEGFGKAFLKYLAKLLTSVKKGWINLSEFMYQKNASLNIEYALFCNLFICYNSTLCCILFVNTEIPEFDVKKYVMCHTILRNVVVSKPIVRWFMEFLTRW